MALDSIKQLRIILCRVLEFALIIAVAVLTLDVLWGVITRYVFGNQAKWTEELARFLLIWVSLLGGAAAFGEKAHLGVDYFVGLMDPAAQKIMTVLSYAAVLFMTITIFLIGGWQLVQVNLNSGQLAPALQIKMGYIYAAVPVAGIFIIVFTIEQLLETISEMKAVEKEAR